MQDSKDPKDPKDNLSGFLSRVYGSIPARLEAPGFDPGQRALLEETIARYQRLAAANPMSDPLAFFYLAARAWRKEIDRQGEELALFCLLYILSLDLLDDVQDDDLSGKPHESSGPAVAINNGMTLFCLGLDALRRAMALAPVDGGRPKYMEAFNRVSLMAGAGQYRDLMGASGAKEPQDVLAMQAAKTSSVALVVELAAIYAGCGDDIVASYREAGSLLCRLIQVVDDLRDIYGKKSSPDLLTKKMTYPLACFLRDAEAARLEEYETLLKQTPMPLKDIRRLLYDSGAVAASAEAIERIRLGLHENLASTGNASAAHRTILYIADTTAGSIYAVPDVQCTQHIMEPDGPWHDRIREIGRSLRENLAPLNPPPMPPLRPWHMPQWMYDPRRRLIYYSDIQDQPEEILPMSMALLGLGDAEETERMSRGQAPVVLAHEFFHYWRDASGRLTADFWYEEWAANILAVSYVKAFAPELSEETLSLSGRIVGRHLEGLSDRGREILHRYRSFRPVPQEGQSGYDVNMAEVAVIQAAMIRGFSEMDLPPLEKLVEKLL